MIQGVRTNLLWKSHFGQIFRSNSLNKTTTRLIRSINLTQNDVPSLRLSKSNRLLGRLQVGHTRNEPFATRSFKIYLNPRLWALPFQIEHYALAETRVTNALPDK